MNIYSRFARLLLLGFVTFMTPQSVRAFKAYGIPVSFRPIHENITREGLGFLKSDFYHAVADGNNYVDTGLSLFYDDPKWHFDDCAFAPSSDQINLRYSRMLNFFNAWYNNPSRQIADLYETPSRLPGDVIDEDDYFCFTFGTIMHAVQDLYSHSNWVELRSQGFVTERLFDTRLSPWWRATSYYEAHPIHQSIVVAEGTTSEATVAGWTASFLQGPDSTAAGKTMKLLSNNGVVTKYGLVSGKYHDFVHGHETVYWGHEDDAGPVSGTNMGLNKDVTGRLYYDQAAELAVLQTAHEWDRLLELLRNQHDGNAKAAALEQAAINYKTQIYVNIADQTANNQYRWAGDDDLQPSDFRVPSGTSSSPFRYVPIAAHAANPAGATMSIQAGTYIGTRRLGKPGQPLRLEKWGGAGNVRLVK